MVGDPPINWGQANTNHGVKYFFRWKNVVFCIYLQYKEFAIKSKNDMKRVEQIIGVVAIVGIVFKLFLLPGGSILTILGLTSLSVFHYAFSFTIFNGIQLGNIFKKQSYKDTNVFRIAVSVLIGIALSITIIGGLFKLQLWTGSNFQMMLGLGVLGTILPIAIFFYFRTKAEFYSRVIKRVAFYGGLGLILFITPTDSIVDFYYGRNPEYAELFKKTLAEPENKELEEQLKQMRKDIRERDSAEE